MKRHLIWIIAGTAAVGLAAPAFAALQPGSTDDRVPGDFRGRCDEVEHADTPECRGVVGEPATSIPSVTVATTTTPDTSAPGGAPVTSTVSSTVDTAPTTSLPDAGPDSSAPDSTVPTSSPDDVSGPCDEAEHADDPRCTGATPGTVDDSGHHDSDDDSSGHGGDDDDSSGHEDDDHSGHGSDD